MRRVISHQQFLAELEQRFGPDPRQYRFVCPACGTEQGAAEFYAAGFKPGTGEVNKYLGYSCVGRFTGQRDQGIVAKNRGESWTKGCNWTLGGLLQIHTLEVECEGRKVPHFEIAPAPTQKAGAP